MSVFRHQTASHPPFSGRWAAVCCLLLSAVAALGAAIPEDAQIINRAAIEYDSSVTGQFTRMVSDPVVVTLRPGDALRLVENRDIFAYQGDWVALPHRLHNDGTLSQDVSFGIANLPGDDFDLESLRVIWDQNGNGKADAGEPVLVGFSDKSFSPPAKIVVSPTKSAPASVTVEPGKYQDLVIEGRLPMVGELKQARVKITAVNAGGTVTLENTDRIRTSTLSTFSFVKEASSLNPPRKGEVIFTLSGNAGGQGLADGYQVMVDGLPRSLVVVRDVVPANMTFVRFEDVDRSLPLYKLHGTPEHTYQTAAPAALEDVEAIAFGFAAMNPGELFRVRFTVRVNENANGTLRNVARIFFSDGLNIPPTRSDSNPVSLEPNGQAPTIRYFTDTTFNVIAEATTLGHRLFVQADAAACNFLPEVAETNTIIIASKLTGDREVYPAIETGPNTGIFRIDTTVLTQDANRFFVVRGDTLVQTVKDDELEASIEGCGASRTATKILIDPVGVVFDSVSNLPLAGAQVTLMNADTGEEAIVFGEDGVTPFPSRIVTGDTGRFLYPTVPAGNYQLVVIPPPGYTNPSKVAPSKLPADRVIDPSGSYGQRFPVSLQTGAVRIDYPVDPIPSNSSQGFFLGKTASARDAEIGDALQYEVQVKNTTGAALTTVDVFDQLPIGFGYEPHSARLDDAPLPEPARRGDGLLAFSIGNVADSKTVRLTYRVRVRPGTRGGDAINRAWAQSGGASPKTSNEGRAVVKVREGVFTGKGVLIGKVFVDINRNRVQDEQEPGIPGVRLYLEDGTFAVTDSEGKYSLYGLSARTHVIKVDRTTLPRGAQLEELGARNAGDADSRFVDLKFGEMHKANFAEASGDPEVLKQVMARRSRGEVFVAEIEKGIKDRLSQETLPTLVGEVRAQPASGTIGGGTAPNFDGKYRLPTQPAQPTAPLVPSSSAASTNTAATPAGQPATTNAMPATPAPGPTPNFQSVLPPETLNGANSNLPGRPAASVPRIPMETLVTNLDNKLEFLDLRDGDTLPIAQATVRVKGIQGTKFELSVNGAAVPGSQVGKKVVVPTTKLEAWEYVGVTMRPGTNELSLRMRDPFGNVRGTNTIHLIAPDNLGRIKVLVPKKDAPADGVTPVKLRVLLEDEHGTPVTARTPLTLDASVGRWDVTDLDRREPGVQVFLEGGTGEFALLPPQEPGEAEIIVTSGILKTRATVPFLPDLRPLIASGVLEGTVNISRLGSGFLSPANSRDGFDEELRSFAITGNNGKQSAAGRAAFFLKGKIKGDYLLTVAYDSEKDTRERLFRDIQPDEFYPVYGDSSVRGFDAQSSGRLYVRIDKRKSYLLLGDFTTQTTSEVRGLGNYNRSLNGVREHYERKNISANAWAAYDSTRQVVEELPANGTSGPYNFKSSNGLLNSERVELLTRDRNQPSLILKTVPMSRFSDYEFEPFTGRLLFKAPVPSLDANLNPISIRITYEIDQGGDKFWVYGADAQVKVTQRVEVGGSAVRDDNPSAPYQLYSANSTVKLSEKTYLLGEAAQSTSDLHGDGRAGRVELRRQTVGTDLRVYYGYTDQTFTNTGSIMMPGRVEGGAKVSQQLGKYDRLVMQGLWTADKTYGGLRRGIRTDWEHNFTNGMRFELGARRSDETASAASPTTYRVGPNEVTSLRTKFSTPVPKVKGMSVYGEYENDVVQTENRMVAVGGDYQLNTRLKAYARHEFINALGGPFELNSLQQNNRTVIGLDSEYMRDGHLFNEYRARDALTGREAEAATGLRNAWTVAEGVRVNTSFERVDPIAGNGQNESTAVAGGIEYTRNPLWKASARLELRTSPTADSLLNTLGYARKLNQDWTLLYRTIFYAVDSPGPKDRYQARVQTGLAYRQTDTDRWSGLIKFETKYEDGVPDLPIKDMQRLVYMLNLDVNYQPFRDWTFSLHYGGKLATETDVFSETTYHAHLVSGRVMYELSRRWDAGLVASTFLDRSGSMIHYGLGPEIGFTFHRNVRLGLGYNFFGFKDHDFNEDYTNPGFYLNMRLKFDESFMGLRNRDDE